MNNRILLRHRSRPFNIFFEKRLNSLENYRKALIAIMNTLTIEARAKDMGKKVFLAIGVKAKRDAEKKCEDRNREREKEKI
jgi:hypothetical protein